MQKIKIREKGSLGIDLLPESYYNLSSVCGSVCPLTALPFTDLQAPNLAGRSGIAHQQSYYNSSSFSAGESQGGNPIGKALVVLISGNKAHKNSFRKGGGQK